MSTPASVTHLRSLASIRERCGRVFELIASGASENWTVDMSKLPEVAAFVVEVMQTNYPEGPASIPFHSRWRHFEPGSIDRAGALRAEWGEDVDAMEVARRKIDLAMTSVLLDAGAGATWKYDEPNGGGQYARSEGLGVASFHMFKDGAFSSDAANPHQADSAALQALTPDAINVAFQVSESNPLVGAEGRAQLLQRLGSSLDAKAEYFAKEGTSVRRPGHIVDYLHARKGADGSVPIHALWQCVIDGLQDMWPASRTTLEGCNMGDVWAHPQLGEGEAGLCSFHKLSQWLTYSLCEPLKESGLVFTDLAAMTGLAEYRNGGLLVDQGVLVPKHAGVLAEPHDPSSTVIVEWRAATVVLLDQIAAAFRELVGTTEESMPLVVILEAGTWKAGRVAAARERPDTCGPPLNIVSDGTVF